MVAFVFILVSLKYSRSLNESKKIALENGVDGEDYDVMRIGVRFYIIPQILVACFFSFLCHYYLLPLLMLPYVPSIYYGLKISNKLERGYDYGRKLGNKINQIVWIGFAGIGLVVIDWIFL